jgi:hypothetical protein
MPGRHPAPRARSVSFCAITIRALVLECNQSALGLEGFRAARTIVVQCQVRVIVLMPLEWIRPGDVDRFR